MPLYPEQRRVRSAVTPSNYEKWMRAVDDESRHHAVEELRLVIPVAAAAAELRTPFPDVSVTQISSRAYGKKWIEMHDDIARRYPRSAHALSGTPFHNIHTAHPELVARAVLDTVSSINDGATDRREPNP
jgi:hypothetical protein